MQLRAHDEAVCAGSRCPVTRAFARKQHGGQVLMPPYRIEGVGELAYVADPEGNLVGVMQYEPGYAPA
ncbi:VOC family protein [uncultured Sphingomonas sp.]|uniref:VOC family protein n=1 Tax=uncultured Sphingomonas sp. TaxID=158754 RepID=UPI0035CA28B5